MKVSEDELREYNFERSKLTVKIDCSVVFSRLNYTKMLPVFLKTSINFHAKRNFFKGISFPGRHFPSF